MTNEIRYVNVIRYARFGGLAAVCLFVAPGVNAANFAPVPLLTQMHHFDVTKAPFYARPDDDVDDTGGITSPFRSL